MTDQSLARIVDELAIRKLLTRYVWAIDTKSWDDLDDIFTPDAEVDYSSSGGPAGDLAEAKAFLSEMMPAFPVTQHLLANVDIDIDGDTATARSACYNPMGAATRDGRPHMFFLGIEYHDALVRSESGWRITKRVETQRWREGSLPAELVFPD